MKNGAIKATWKGGQIVPDEPLRLREGQRLAIEPLADGVSGTGHATAGLGSNGVADCPPGTPNNEVAEDHDRPPWWERLGPIEFMTEEEQGDTPEAIRAWIDAADARPPLVLTDEEEERLQQYFRDIGKTGPARRGEA